MLDYSVIIPTYNEQDSIETLCNSLFGGWRSISDSFEIIFVDDGSDDNSGSILDKLSLSYKELVSISLARHMGKSHALAAGFARSQGRTIITLDADLQHDLDDIPLLLSKKGQGFDVVCGWRHERCDPYTKIIAARFANLLRRLVFQEKIHDVGCSFRVYSREAFAAIQLYRERHRFITAILARKGFKLGEVKVRHYPRRLGMSKYSVIGRLIKSIPDFVYILFKG